LDQFKQKLDSGEISRSAAEICDINLLPNTSPSSSTGAFDPTSASAVQIFWTANALTGDNSRERPYNGLYPRLTTKSNTFTIHVRAQSLKMPPGLSPASDGTGLVWVENPQLTDLSKIANSWRRWKTVHGRSVFFNHSPGPASATLPFSLLGLTGKQAPRDLWRQKDLGTFDTHFTAETQSHGVVLIRLIPITATN
jgi:hypothetical protein